MCMCRCVCVLVHAHVVVHTCMCVLALHIYACAHLSINMREFLCVHVMPLYMRVFVSLKSSTMDGGPFASVTGKIEL